jgi:hypothetical protein
MQPITSYDRLIYGAPGLFFGFIVGYFVGGTRSLTMRDRLLIAVAFILIGGLIFILVLGIFIVVGTFEVVLSMISTAGGFLLGIVSNWVPPEEPPFKVRMTFDPEEADEEFDRQIDEALGLRESESES